MGHLFGFALQLCGSSVPTVACNCNPQKKAPQKFLQKQRCKTVPPSARPRRFALSLMLAPGGSLFSFAASFCFLGSLSAGQRFGARWELRSLGTHSAPHRAPLRYHVTPPEAGRGSRLRSVKNRAPTATTPRISLCRFKRRIPFVNKKTSVFLFAPAQKCHAKCHRCHKKCHEFKK